MFDKYLVPYETLTFKKIRLGTKGDGGYVVVDNNLDGYTGLMSLGIDKDISFDIDFHEISGGKVHQYDGTIDGPPSLIDGSRFFKKMVYGADDFTDEDDLGERRFLKMDIEGAEWNLLPTMDLTKYEQIAIEIHGKWFKNSFEPLKHLTEHHNIVHVHGNSCELMPMYYQTQRDMISWIPASLELTLLRKDIGDFGPNTTTYPVEGLDYPCDINGRPDWDLSCIVPFIPTEVPRIRVT